MHAIAPNLTLMLGE